MWRTTDPDGRAVILSEERWAHIVDGHEELEGEHASILAAVAGPVARHPGRDPGEEWFYGQGFGPSLFVKVVVHFRGDAGAITTAFPRRWLP